MEYLQTLRGEKGLQIESWSKNDLIKAVQEFIRINPKNINVDLNYKQENNINNENNGNELIIVELIIM
jgi:septum formation topological specificity factor MinE